jgi:hypothetical protein
MAQDNAPCLLVPLPARTKHGTSHYVLFPWRKIQRKSLHPPLLSSPCKHHFPCSVQVKWIINCVSHIRRSRSTCISIETFATDVTSLLFLSFCTLTRVSKSIAVSTQLQLISLSKLCDRSTFAHMSRNSSQRLITLVTRTRNASWIHSTPSTFCFCKIHFKIVGFEALTSVVMKNAIFWDITPCSPVKSSRCFGGKCCLHLQSRRLNQTNPRMKMGSKQSCA